MNGLRFGAIGAGHMGGAILRAVLDTGLISRIHISSPVPSELNPFAARGCITGSDNRQTVRESDLILLAVRPHQVSEVLAEIAGETAGKCILSIAAGLPVSSIRSQLPENAYVLRAMPNLPLAAGCGATVLAKPEGVPEQFFETARALFECAGTVEILDESLINAATALGGSGVAYYFRMAAVMSEWAQSNGIPYDAALRLTAQTMAGASRMLLAAEKTPEALASGVAVPGGTTEAAFRAFDKAGFDQALCSGLDACRNRADELMS